MNPVLADFVAGTLGGSAGIVVAYPLDTVKVRLQTQNAFAPLYKGTSHCLVTIIKHETLRGMYKGMSSPLCGVAVINAVVFGVYGNSMRYLHENTLQNHFLAGMFAGTVQTLISSPMELAKTKMQVQGIFMGLGLTKTIKLRPRRQVQKPSLVIYTSPMDCLRKLYQANGLHGVCRGMGATLLREVPAFGSYFFLYEYLIRWMTPPPDPKTGIQRQIGIWKLLWAGGVSGVVSWIISFPQDVIKSRYQAHDHYTSLRQCALDSYRQEGWPVFCRGLWSTILRAFPTNAVTLAVVTVFLRHFGNLNHTSSVDVTRICLDLE